jgi:hypothetical protein
VNSDGDSSKAPAIFRCHASRQCRQIGLPVKAPCLALKFNKFSDTATAVQHSLSNVEGCCNVQLSASASDGLEHRIGQPPRRAPLHPARANLICKLPVVPPQTQARVPAHWRTPFRVQPSQRALGGGFDGHHRVGGLWLGSGSAVSILITLNRPLNAFSRSKSESLSSRSQQAQHQRATAAKVQPQTEPEPASVSQALPQGGCCGRRMGYGDGMAGRARGPRR